MNKAALAWCSSRHFKYMDRSCCASSWITFTFIPLADTFIQRNKSGRRSSLAVLGLGLTTPLDRTINVGLLPYTGFNVCNLVIDDAIFCFFFFFLKMFIHSSFVTTLSWSGPWQIWSPSQEKWEYTLAGISPLYTYSFIHSHLGTIYLGQHTYCHVFGRWEKKKNQRTHGKPI